MRRPLITIKNNLILWLNTWSKALLAGIGLAELRAILRGDEPTEKPNPRYRAHVLSMLLHIRPRNYAAASTWFTHTFRLGFLSVFLLFVEIVTGLILMLYYVPTPEGAYLSILRLNSEIAFGEILRDVHRLAAEAMVITAVLHLLRTFLTASYKKERRFTWFSGVLLLFITLFFAFTGYLLPWDQLSYWAVTIGTSMAASIPFIGGDVNLILRGGPEIGADGLLRFYQLHVFLLPALTVVLLSVHYYRVARIHSISLPAWVEESEVSEEVRRSATRKIDLIPDLIIHEWLWMALGTLLLLVAAYFWYDAPLESHANPFSTPLETQAPWFFLWVQGLLKLGDKIIWGVLVPGGLAISLLIFPYLDRNPHRMVRKRIAEIALALASLATLVVLSYMGTAQYGIHLQEAVQVAQKFAPEEHSGLVHQVSYADLPLGVFPIGQAATEILPADFSALLAGVENAIVTTFGQEAAQTQAWIIVEERQVDLKRVILRFQWEDAERGTQFHERIVYIHREALEILP